MTSSSIHAFDLDATEPQAVCKGGNRTIINASNFPMLKGMAVYLLRLERGGIREYIDSICASWIYSPY
jgi:oxalate decarboxylase